MRSSLLGIAAVVWAGALAGCGEARAPEPAVAGAPTLSAPSERAQLRASYVAARQSQAARSARYHVTQDAQPAFGDKQLTATNPAQDLGLRFSVAGVELAPNSRRWQLGLETTAVACDATVHRLVPTQPVTRAAANRIEYRRSVSGAPFTEWYVNGPLGLEQGFTLQKSPCDGAATRLGIRLEVSGLSPSLEVRPAPAGETSQNVALRDGSGALVARYADLFVLDARGRALPAGLRVAEDVVRLEVDVTGAAWPVTIDPLIWAEQQLSASDGHEYDNFGYAVAVQGDTALVGSYLDDDDERGPDSGSAYVFVRSGNVWTEQQKLTASEGSQYDYFGVSVALSGDTALVGAVWDNETGFDSGSAYVFVRSGNVWTEQKRLLPSDGAEDDLFGGSVALSGDTALVGAYSDDDDESGPDSGSAYVFVRSGNVWTEQQKLTASDAAAGDTFGRSVALSGETALLGAYADDDIQNGDSSGSAYAFVRSATTWVEQAKLVADDAAEGDNFGWSVALSGDTALVGAYGDDDLGDYGGAAYVFARSGTAWTQQQKLTASDGGYDDVFGVAVALSGDRALIGAGEDDEIGFDSGSAYVFERTGTTWTEQKKLTASDAAQEDGFGYSVALDDDTALVGALWHDGSETNTGSAYLYELGLEPGDACTLDQDCLSQHCVEQVCCDTECTGACRTCLAARKASGSDGTCGNVKLGSECGAASCPSITSQNLADSCDGAGACTVTPETACDPGQVCVSGACTTSCSGDEQCDTSSGYMCLAGACRIPTGQGCTPTDDCEAGYCVDGVCCASACSGECTACAHQLTAEPDGTCAPIPSDQDPEDECPQDPSYPESCGKDGACDGAGACRTYAKPSTACGDAPTSCADGVIHGQLCDGSGNCEDSNSPCSPYACAGDACATSCAGEDECNADEGYCVEGGSCAETKQDGASCTEGLECSSGHCNDGMCCDFACGGYDCDAGSCRTTCDSDSDCAAGFGCSADQKCVPKTSQCIDQDSASRNSNNEVKQCAPYLCDPSTGACGVTCTSSSDCATSFLCDADSRTCESKPAPSRDDAGCACRAAGGSEDPRWPALSVAALGLLALLRRRPEPIAP